MTSKRWGEEFQLLLWTIFSISTVQLPSQMTMQLPIYTTSKSFSFSFSVPWPMILMTGSCCNNHRFEHQRKPPWFAQEFQFITLYGWGLFFFSVHLGHGCMPLHSLKTAPSSMSNKLYYMFSVLELFIFKWITSGFYLKALYYDIL